MDMHMWRWISLILLDLIWIRMDIIPWSVEDLGMAW